MKELNLFANPILVSIFAVLFSSLPSLGSPPALTLDDFLSQVKANHLGIKSSETAEQAGQLRSKEGQLLLAPTVFIHTQVTSDARIPNIAFLGFSSLVTKTFSLGVSKLTPFGLQGKLHYDILEMTYNNPVSLFSIPGMPSFVPTSYAVVSPVLELSQNFWSNGFGSSTRAQQEQIEAQALASSYQAHFMSQQALAQAESAYWRLNLARQALRVQKEALDRAQKIHEWNARRARLHLGETSDLLQAEALVQNRELDLETARNEERSAALAFNSARNIDSEFVSEGLPEIEPNHLDDVRPPTRTGTRKDVQAAQQMARAAAAGAEIALQRDKPVLDLVGSIALNGQSPASAGIPGGYQGFSTIGESMSQAFSFNRPTLTVGLRFSVPIDFPVMCHSQDGWRKEKIAAELNYDRKVFEQDQSWKDLNRSFLETKKHLKLARKLEWIQQAKLKNERDRLLRGRTTTYQVLVFEQDYLLTQLLKIKDQATLLTLIAQMKLFGEVL